jgi:hypothetical protein
MEKFNKSYTVTQGNLNSLRTQAMNAPNDDPVALDAGMLMDYLPEQVFYSFLRSPRSRRLEYFRMRLVSTPVYAASL